MLKQLAKYEQVELGRHILNTCDNVVDMGAEGHVYVHYDRQVIEHIVKRLTKN